MILWRFFENDFGVLLRSVYTRIMPTAMHAQPVTAAAQRLLDAQAAMRALLEGAGLQDAKAADVGRTLGLDKSLAWKVARFIRDDDPLRAARHMPGSGGVDIVLRAASERGVDDDRIAAVREAVRALREFVEQHAGDRRSFEAMFAAEGRAGGLELEVRRELFRAASAAWGVRARTQFLTLALRPSADVPGAIDFVKVAGFIDLERLRMDVPWIISRLTMHDDAGRSAHPVTREPLEPNAGDGMALMTRHCSHPMPRIRRFAEGNCVYDELAPGPIGRRGAVTVVMGEKYLAAASHVRAPQNEWAVYPFIVRTPVEGLQFDLLLHPDLAHFGPARVARRGLLEDRPRPAGGLMKLDTEAAASLRLPLDPGASRVPRYAELMAEAFERAGWSDVENYRAFRADLEYPLAPSEITLMCEIGSR